jgi:hypothetical protein
LCLRWQGGREPGQIWSISLVESLNNKFQSLNHANCQWGGSPSTVKLCAPVTASKGKSLQNSSSPKSFEHYAIFVPIFKWIYSRNILSWIYFKYTNHFNFTCYPIYFPSSRRFNLCRNRQTFKNFRHGITLWIYALGSAFSQKYATLLLNNEHIPRTWRKNDLCFGYSTVIENDFQCWLTVYIIWWRLGCAASTFNLFYTKKWGTSAMW